jgi:VanZ family protein
VRPRIPRWLFRIAFVCFALLLFTLTHWPALTIPGPGRPDLIAHATTFAIWTALLIACGFFGRPLSRTNILLCVVIAVAYAAFDEATQAIPWLRRHATFEDFLFNLVGIALAAAGALLLARLRTPRADTSTA